MKKEIKEKAQDELIAGMQIALSQYIEARDARFPEVRDCFENEVYQEMIKQFRRIEKYLGYRPNTFHPGV